MTGKLIKTVTIMFLLFTASAYGLSLSADDNLGTWRKAPSSAQAQLCDLMAKRMELPELTPTPLCICISETAGGGSLDFLKIAEVAASCAILITQ